MGHVMARLQKMFRIEAAEHGPRAAMREGSQAIIEEIRALRSLIEPHEAVSQRMIDTFRRELAEAQEMRQELEAVRDAIERTKIEIATVHHSGFRGTQMIRVTGELDAIVKGTLDATDAILSAAETIDRDARVLEASVTSRQDSQSAVDIQEQVVKIFEACNFQDLTGQRISKVVSTLSFIEDRIMRMMEIWGGIESFGTIEAVSAALREGDDGLLNGPRLDADLGHASQDDIDALFN
jgi:chemotaxis protein CheZ